MNIIYKIFDKIFGTKEKIEIYEAQIERINANSEERLKIVLNAKEEDRELTEIEKIKLDILSLKDATYL